MDIAALVGQSLVFIFPAYCANAAPVLVGRGTKMDFGRSFVDGKRVFGDNKTFRGFFFGLAVGILVGLADVFAFHLPILFAVLTPLGALMGDLAGAFLKRRLRIAPGQPLPVVDQIDFVLGALLFSVPLEIVNWELAITVLLITPPIHLLTNYGAYKLRLKRNPW